MATVVAGLSLACREAPEAVEPGTTDPTPDGQVTPVTDEQGFRDFARQLDEALRTGDFRFFANSVQYEKFECTGVQGLPAQPQACEGLPVGSTVDAILISTWQSAGSYYDPGQFAELVKGLLFRKDYPDISDAYGEARPRLYAIGTLSPRFEIDPGAGERAQAIVTAIAPVPGFEAEQRQALMFAVSFDGERWRITDVTRGAPTWFLDPASEDTRRDLGEPFATWERWDTTAP
jgi:hypothetical protein